MVIRSHLFADPLLLPRRCLITPLEMLPLPRLMLALMPPRADLMRMRRQRLLSIGHCCRYALPLICHVFACFLLHAISPFFAALL